MTETLKAQLIVLSRYDLVVSEVGAWAQFWQLLPEPGFEGRRLDFLERASQVTTPVS
jgi:hypothetical protein